jgi:MOSC domain-containing protein YiiM
MARVVALHVLRRHEADPEPVDRVQATAVGLDGDVHAGRHGGKRQVLVVATEDLARVGLRPGDLREQVTVDLEGLMHLPPGSRLQVGDVVLELTGPCEPCTHIGEHLGVEDREAFRQTLQGRRGMLARVAPGGEGIVGVGDEVRASPVDTPAPGR